MLPDITRRIGVPRALAVPFALGYPLGVPADAAGQRAILDRLLALCGRTDVPVLQTLAE